MSGYTTEELNKMYDEAMEELLIMEKQFERTGFFTSEDKELSELRGTASQIEADRRVEE